MSSADNRAAANLVLLCIEHSYEVDEFSEKYPPELLLEWKRRQLAEYDEIQRAWPLNDAEAAEVAEVSFDAREVGLETAGAASVLAAARAVGLLVATARRQRELPRRQALAWKATRDRVRGSSVAWDENGERLYAEPSAVETNRHRAALIAALDEATAVVAPLADAVHAEMRAIAAVDLRLSRWCDWVDAAAHRVVEAAGHWPGSPPFEDDDIWENSLAELTRAVDALTAKWRRQEAVELPDREPHDATAPIEDDAQRALREHEELLELARPFARVDHRPYDSTLYERVSRATEFAALLPPVLSLLAVNLHATAGLAAAVARNADDATFRILLSRARQQRPLAASVFLCHALAKIAKKKERADLHGEADAATTAILMAQNWQDPQVWLENENYGRSLLGLTADVSSAEGTRATLEAALRNDQNLLSTMLTGCAEWIEQHDSRDMSMRLGVRRCYTELPSWFPTTAIYSEIRRQLPAVVPADEWRSERLGDELHMLAAQVLHLALA